MKPEDPLFFDYGQSICIDAEGDKHKKGDEKSIRRPEAEGNIGESSHHVKSSAITHDV